MAHRGFVLCIAKGERLCAEAGKGLTLVGQGEDPEVTAAVSAFERNYGVANKT